MNEPKNYTTYNSDETFEIGARFALQLVAGDVVFLYGELGAGKTLFTKGMLDGLGYDPDEVTSPSFSLVNLYRSPGPDVYHIDLWRIAEEADASAAVGLDEILDQENTITVIEWPERLDCLEFPRSPIAVKITGNGDGPRNIAIADDAS